MASTPAQRQKAYRERRSTAGENGERRLNTWLTTGASLALARLARHHGISQRAMIERLLLVADQEVLDSLDLDTPEWTEYMRVTA